MLYKIATYKLEAVEPIKHVDIVAPITLQVMMQYKL